MALTNEQILEAKGRGESVVNGFLTPKLQNARDTIALADECLAKQREIDSLHKKILALQLKSVGNPSYKNAFDELFGDTFKKKGF